MRKCPQRRVQSDPLRENDVPRVLSTRRERDLCVGKYYRRNAYAVSGNFEIFKNAYALHTIPDF